MVITTLNGCSSSPSDVYSFLLGIEKNDAFKGILFYPNPAHDNLIIENENYLNPVAFEIINTNGKSFYNSILFHKSIIDLTMFSSGTYLIRFKKDGLFYSLKFIKDNKLITRR